MLKKLVFAELATAGNGPAKNMQSTIDILTKLLIMIWMSLFIPEVSSGEGLNKWS